MAANIPANLKVIQPFLKLAKEYETRDPIVAYWSRYHAVQVGIKNKTKENVSFLMNLMDLLEKTKQSQSHEEAITNDVVAQAHLENKGVQLFLWADSEDRASRFNKNVVKSFYSASLIFDILTVFGELNDEIAAQRKYSKWKAAYINNCLKKGETPVPGPVGGDGEDTQLPNIASGPGLPYPEQPPSNLPNLPPSVVYPPGGPPATQNPQQPQYPSQPQSYPATNAQPPQAHPSPQSSATSSKTHLEPMDYAKAQKYCKYASSALQYEDVNTAIDNLQKALKLLQTGKDSG
ncbi:vacuolar protein sorting-associated protein VTA1 homolog [Dendronephthya gigantea]|uniref:vacuolar protein sorting-associated protein VTA1 homolog n=1 Tax=Dendronephthya gigantea TaxID=151771 RepID=UPI00106B1D47|nr:vacuolar protein sorting-associated protein VTA1 homolog [Dendronephthya gigantea]